MTGKITKDIELAKHGCKQWDATREHNFKVYAGTEVKIMGALASVPPHFKCGAEVVYGVLNYRGEMGALCQHQVVINAEAKNAN